MFRIFAIGIDVLSAAVILIPVFILLRITLLREKKHTEQLLYILFALYLSAVFSAAGIPTLTSLTIDPHFNLIPFIDAADSPFNYIKNSLLNILLFVPLGFFLPLLWKEFQTLRYTVICGFCLSLGIEILQIFTFRLTDIDDLITNTLGALPGFFIARLFFTANTASAQKPWHDKAALLLTVGVIFLIWFAVQPFIAGCFWELILK